MTRRLVPLLLLALSFCTPAPPPQTAPPAPPAFAATAVARRVVLLSFDGLGADMLARQTNLPAFERLAREGASVRVINIDPTLTAPTHVAILTGAEAQTNGIVSNRFHLPGTPPEHTTRGMNTDADVETLVEAARRQGKRVGVVSFPTIDNKTPRRAADFGLAWSEPLAPAKLVKLTRSDFKREWVPPTWTARPQRRTSFSPIMRARLEWGVPKTRVRTDIDVVAYDTTNDARENYDAFFVESSERELAMEAHGWFAISQYTDDGLTGSWSKIVRMTPTLDVTIYWGAVSRSEAWPEAFGDLLDDHAGFWPGEPEQMLAVDASLFLEQLERLADFYTRAQTIAIERMPFDLLLAYQPEIDGAAHAFLGTPEADRGLRVAFVAADRAVNAIAERLQPSDAFVVTGDHGLVAADRELQVNRLLQERGFAPRWRAFTSGAHAHLYRFSGPDDADAVVALLNATGLFERIEKKSTTSHRNSGDVIAWAYPNVALTSVDGDRFSPHGQHGALNTHREMHSVLFAIGTGVPQGVFGEIRQTQIARFVAELLGIAPPSGAAGS